MTPRVVAMFSESYLPRISGVVRSLEDFSRALRAEGHRVLIIAPAYHGFTDTDSDVIRLPSVVLPAHPEFPVAVPYRAGLIDLLRARRVDVVHTHSPFLVGGLALAVARRLNAPLVFTHHTLYHEYVHYVPLLPASTSRRLVLGFTRRFAQQCNRVIAPEPVIRDLLRAQGMTAPIEVLPTGGVDLKQFARLDGRAVRVRFGIPPTGHLLLTVSRLAPEKSVDLVLHAFRQVGGAGEAYLLIVGGGPSAGALERLAASLGIADRVRFAGALPHGAVLEAMAAADLFVFASQTEAQGLVLLEAMGAGLPVVAVGRGGAVEVVRDRETGWLVEPDAGALARAVQDLLNTPERRQAFSRRAREIAGDYALPALARRLAALYDAVIAEKQQDALPQRT